MIDELLGGFMGSPQAQQALGVLQGQHGLTPADAQSTLGHALSAATASMKSAVAGHPEPAKGLLDVLGGHAGRSFVEGAVAGLVRGDGLVGSLEDGGMGTLGGHVAEVIATRTGVNSNTASALASAATPFIAHFVHDMLSK